MKRYFITGIDTNVGKTIASAVLVEALQADYWKPIQTGLAEGSDTGQVTELITNKKTKLFKESYTFVAPVSPHSASAIESKNIEWDKIVLPKTDNHLIIEGAGGLLVPLNQSNYMIELARKFDAEVVLVIRNYLGCINHSLLSIDYLLKHNFKIKGLILNGNFDTLVEESILRYSEIPVLAKFPEVNRIERTKVWEFAMGIKKDNLL